MATRNSGHQMTHTHTQMNKRPTANSTAVRQWIKRPSSPITLLLCSPHVGYMMASNHDKQSCQLMCVSSTCLRPLSTRRACCQLAEHIVNSLRISLSTNDSVDTQPTTVQEWQRTTWQTISVDALLLCRLGMTFTRIDRMYSCILVFLVLYNTFPTCVSRTIFSSSFFHLGAYSCKHTTSL